MIGSSTAAGGSLNASTGGSAMTGGSILLLLGLLWSSSILGRSGSNLLCRSTFLNSLLGLSNPDDNPCSTSVKLTSSGTSSSREPGEAARTSWLEPCFNNRDFDDDLRAGTGPDPSLFCEIDSASLATILGLEPARLMLVLLDIGCNNYRQQSASKKSGAKRKSQLTMIFIYLLYIEV
jgi:hypothetical protein